MAKFIEHQQIVSKTKRFGRKPDKRVNSLIETQRIIFAEMKANNFVGTSVNIAKSQP